MGKRSGLDPAAANRLINGERLVALRCSGSVPAGPVIVSFAGFRYVPNFVLIAHSGRQYDWRLVHGLSVIVLVNDDVAVADLLPIVREATVGECSIWHIQRERGAWVYLDATLYGDRLVIDHLRPLEWCSWQHAEFAQQLRGFDEFFDGAGQF
jgi:hypothetical protein